MCYDPAFLCGVPHAKPQGFSCDLFFGPHAALPEPAVMDVSGSVLISRSRTKPQIWAARMHTVDGDLAGLCMLLANKAHIIYFVQMAVLCYCSGLACETRS